MTPEEKRQYCKELGYSALYAEYWVKHPGCEYPGCGVPSEPPHHVRTRKAGGTDSPGNLIAYCLRHHRMAHTRGDLQMGRQSPNLEAKIARAKGIKSCVRVW